MRRARNRPIADLQRARMLAAMCEVCRDLGPGRVSVTDVVARSGVSRRTFYETFADKEQCLLAVLEEGLQRASRRVVPAFQAQDEWRAAVRAGMYALLGFIEEDPLYARLLIVDALAAGDQALARRTEAVEALVDAVDGGRRLARVPKSVTRSTAEGLVGGVLAILHARLAQEGGALSSDLAGELMALILTPYLGAAVAGKEIQRLPPAWPAQAPISGNPLADLRMRLTHRTVLVLHSIGRHPGRSNRGIADLAGIGDPGQASKLLTRLAALGLIENARATGARGEPNAWRLTAEGARLEQAMAVQRTGW
jgi:AcrR family transcriptional regulator